jgi:uncharacterized membrane protein YjjP (DUF1212 family)
MSDPVFDDTCSFIVKLGTTAQGYGVSSSRLESYLSRVTKALGLRGDFLVTPEKIDSVLWRDGDERQRVNVTRIPHAGLSMAGVAQVEELVDRVESGAVSVEEGSTRLAEIDQMPMPFGPLAIAASFGLIGAGFAVLLSLAWPDIIIGTLLSVVVYAVVFLLGREPRLARLLNPLAAFIAGVLAYALAATLMPGSNYRMVTLCAVIALIPNPGLVLGIGELASNHVLSGAIRLMSAVVVLIELAFGAFLGISVASALMSIPAGATAAASLAPGWAWLAAAVLGVGLGMLFQVPTKGIVWVVLASLVAFAGMVFGGKLLGHGPSSLVGALVLGVFANAFAWRSRRPASVVLLPALMVLAPGYAAYLGLGTLQASGVAAGFDAEFKVLVSVAWIIGGLFLANAIVPPKSTL